MKTASIMVVAAAAVASAQFTQEKNGTWKCDKPNVNYCLGSDIILRCDSNGNGTPGRCSDNLAGYPPAGGFATCYESAEDAGDAACEKNCVVYAQPSFTLPADVCKPTYTSSVESTFSTIATHSTPSAGNKTTTATYTQPTHHAGNHTKTTTTVETSNGHPVIKTITYVHSSIITADCTTTHHLPKTTFNPNPTGSGGHHGNGTSSGGNGGKGGKGGNGGSGSNGGSGNATHTPIAPTSGPTSIPTAGATMNSFSGLLAAIGFAVAYML